MAGGAYVVHGTSSVERIEAPVTLKAYIMCAFAAFGGIFFGYDTGWMGGILGMKYFIHQYTGLDYPTATSTAAYKSAFVIPSWQQSLMTSILSCGNFFGALIAGDIADRIGRRFTIITGCIVFSIGCILETASTSLAVMTVGRLIAGLGVGFISAIIILYMSEIAPKKVRGALVAGYQFCITIGILLANCVVYSTQNRLDTGSYRIPIAVQFLWAIILGLGLFFLPESPRYFVKKGELGSAAKALASVRGQPIESPYIQDELAEIIANNEYEKSVMPVGGYFSTWSACFHGRIGMASSNLRRTLCGIGLQAMQQFTGINFIFYYGVVFFAGLGTISNPFLISLITTLVNVLSTPIAFWMVERFGRRKLLVVGGTGMIICQYIVGIIGVTAGKVHGDGTFSKPAVSAMIAFICINITMFAGAWGPCAWIVIGETFPLPIRSRGVALSTASNWFCNCIIAIITPYLTGREYANLGAKIFFMWGSLCIISVTFAYFLVPETKGLSLEQVDRMLEEVNPRHTPGWKPSDTYASRMDMVIKQDGAHGGIIGGDGGGGVGHGYEMNKGPSVGGSEMHDYAPRQEIS